MSVLGTESHGRQLMLQRRDLPFFPLLWVLERHAEPADLASDHPAAQVLREHLNAPGDSTPAADLMRQMLWVHRPDDAARLAFRLFFNHGATGCALLFTVLPGPLSRGGDWSIQADAAAWGASHAPRQAVELVRTAWPRAGGSVRRKLLQCLWYLEEAAAPALPLLAEESAALTQGVRWQCRAAGVRPTLDARRSPLYLEPDSLEQIAYLAFSTDREDRLYAVRCLDGWGPALSDARRILEPLTRDSDSAVREAAQRMVGR